MLGKVVEVLKRRGVECEIVHPVDAGIKVGVKTDMGKGDSWPATHEKLLTSDIANLTTYSMAWNRSGGVDYAGDRIFRP